MFKNLVVRILKGKPHVLSTTGNLDAGYILSFKVDYCPCFSLTVFAVPSCLGGIILFGLLLIGYGLAGLGLGFFTRKLRFILVFGLFIFLIQLIAVKEGVLLWQLFLGPIYFSVWSEGLFGGLRMMLRLVNIIGSSYLFVATTDPNRLAYALMQAGLPYRFGFMLITALRFIPIFQPERQLDQQTDEQKELQLREESASSTRLEHKQLEPLDGSFRLPGDYLMRRRPDLYHQLMCAGHLWRPETFFGLDRHSPLPEGRESLVGLIQFEAVPGNRDANLTRIQQWVTRAKQEQPGLQLLVFPELANTGLVTNKMSELAESIPGATSTFLSQVAVEHAIYLAWGMAERGEDGSVYITAVLAGPDGRIYTYRKVHLLARDEVWAQRGSALPMPIDTSLGRIGLLLGTDLLFPEAARCLANQGVDLIVVPAALAGPGPVGLSPEQNLEICSAKINDPYHWSVWRVRAWENSVYLIVANKAGKGEVRRGLNLSGIFGPIAYERSEAAQEILTDSMEGMLVKTISTSRTTREGRRVRAKDNLRRRQIGLYRELVLQG
jgi:predicted amidohydrolase